MRKYDSRQYVVIIFIVLIGLIYIGKLFYIQVINDEYKLKAITISRRKQKVYPVRGYIYDRNGKILVYNEAAYDLMVIPNQVKAFDTIDLCRTIGITKQEFDAKMKKITAHKYNRYVANVFEKKISSDTYARLQEKLFNFQGFYVQNRTLRKYPYNIAANILGYIGEVSKQKVAEDEYYKPGDYIGISGIEKSYENYLRGKCGTKMVVVDNLNREVGSYKEGKYDTLPIAGIDLTCTIDYRLQKYGEQLMRNKTGSIVAIEPSSGEILTMVTSPTYDPNLLVGRTRNKNYTKLQQDTLKPLFNRALMAEYPPGSIFKVLQALIGLQDGVINENTTFACNKALVGCHNHPTATSIQKSIQYSCNPYYYNVFKKIIQQGKYTNIFKDSEYGLSDWRKKAVKFGFGAPLGIDVFGEKGGFIPTVEFYDKWYGHHRWAFSTIYSLSIGQGEIMVVPLQMANFAAIIANRGFYYLPHLVKQIHNGNTISKKYLNKNTTDIDTTYFNMVVEGMRNVIIAPGGTARRAKIDSITICGKTGTVQNPHGEDHSVFIAFAPMHNPKIAIAVYVENSGFGGTWAAPVASLIIEKYLKGYITNKSKEERILNANLINPEENE